MPYVWWQGTTLSAELVSGYAYVPSELLLDNYLLKNQIALLTVKRCKWRMWFYKISTHEKLSFFQQLSDLLSNGLSLVSALTLLAWQSENPHVQKALFHCLALVEQGIPLWKAMETAHYFFDAIAVQTIAVGMQTGTVTTVCKLLATYYQMYLYFQKKIAAALFTPLITLLFLAILLLLLAFFFMPHLQQVFQSLHVELPYSTQLLIEISAFIRSPSALYMVGIIFCFVGAVSKLKQFAKFRQWIKNSIYRLPFIRILVTLYHQMIYFSFLSLLLQAHIPVAQALNIICSIITSSTLHKKASIIAQHVSGGAPLDRAMAQFPTFFQASQVATIAVAQESNTLAVAVQKLSEQTVQKVDAFYSKITFWLGPVLLLLLGFGITALIVAVYSPLLQMSFDMQ